MSSKPSQTPASFCRECGFKLEPGTKFCPNCGTPVRNTGQHATAAPKPLRINGREDFLSCDYYELLGIGREANIQEIRKAIVKSREQVASWPDSADKKNVLKRLMGAQTTLTDDDARAKYAVELFNKQMEPIQEAGQPRHASTTVAGSNQIQPVSQARADSGGSSAQGRAHAGQTSQPEQPNPPVVYATVVQQPQQAANDSGSFGWAVLGFIIPLVGLILWLVWKSEKPETAKRCIHGAVVSIVINILFYLVGGCSLLALM